MIANPSKFERFVTDDIYFRLLEGLPVSAPIVRAVVQWATFACVPPWRRRLIQNATLALGPDSSPFQRSACAFGMLGAMQRLISDVMMARALSATQLAGRVVQIDGSAEYFAARTLRRGVIIAGIHMGAFEPSLAVLCQRERRVHVLFQPDPMQRFERARQQLRRELGVVEHHVADGISSWDALLCALRADEAVVLHGDFVLPGQRGVVMPFLGKPDAHLPSGAVRLSAAAGAPIVPTFCARIPGGLRVWADGWIPPPSAPIASKELSTHPAQVALVAAMERTIRKYPQQWMAFMNLAAPATAPTKGHGSP